MKETISISPCRMMHLGMGDILREVLWGSTTRWFSRLQDLSKEYDIRLICYSRNDNTYRLFDSLDYISEVVNVPYNKNIYSYPTLVEEFKKQYPDFLSFDQLIDLLQKKNCKPKHIYFPLEKNEQRIFDDIISKPYIVLHPFAGGNERIVFTKQQYKILIRELIRKTNCNVVIVGGSHFKRSANPKSRKEIITPRRIESLDIEGNRIYNLVNKTSPKLPVRLIQEANLFIGNWSCYACASWVTRTPSIVITKDGGEKAMLSPGFKYSRGIYGVMHPININRYTNNQSCIKHIVFVTNEIKDLLYMDDSGIDYKEGSFIQKRQ